MEPLLHAIGSEVLFKLHRNPLLHGAHEVGLHRGSSQRGIDVPQAFAQVRSTARGGDPGRGRVHVRDAKIPVERAERIGNVFQRLPCELPCPLNLARQRSFLFTGFLPQACHLQLRFHARHQFPGGEGLGQIVVRASLQPLDAGFFSSSRRKHDDRNNACHRILPQRGQQCKAIHLRHHHVCQHQVGTLLFRLFERPFAVLCRNDFEASAQQAPQVLPHVGVVVHQQDHRLLLFRGDVILGSIAVRGSRNLVLQPVPSGQPPQRLAHIGHRGALQNHGAHRIRHHAPVRQVALPKRQSHGERRPRAQLTLHGNRAAVHLHQFLHQRQADAAALVTPPPRTLHAAEPLKQVRQLAL